ncbi:MAG: hypothetical protein SCK70_00515 [bacterium]|nr:hypothetical protein [bacterium]
MIDKNKDMLANLAETFNLNYSQIWAKARRIEQLANPSFKAWVSQKLRNSWTLVQNY